LNEGYLSEGGITLAELGRHQIRVLVDAEAAGRIDEAEIVVTFEVDQRLFEQVRGELAAVFRDQPGGLSGTTRLASRPIW
jgi:hypothetical protein